MQVLGTVKEAIQGLTNPLRRNNLEARRPAHELLLKLDMGAGHGGPSGRLGSVRDTAEISAWLLEQAARAK